MKTAIRFRKRGISSKELRDMLNLSGEDFLKALCRGELVADKDKTFSFSNVLNYCLEHNIKFDANEFVKRATIKGKTEIR